MTAFIFLHIHSETTPLSNCLQTSGFNILKAYKMVQVATEKVTQNEKKRFRREGESWWFCELECYPVWWMKLGSWGQEMLPQKITRKIKTSQEKLLQMGYFEVNWCPFFQSHCWFSDHKWKDLVWFARSAINLRTATGSVDVPDDCSCDIVLSSITSGSPIVWAEFLV